MLELPKMSSYPSGAAFATRVAAARPLLPATFSTFTGCPSFSASRGAKMRAAASSAPPAGKPTTKVSGRAGQSCAAAGGINDKDASKMRKERDKDIMRAPLRGGKASAKPQG